MELVVLCVISVFVISNILKSSSGIPAPEFNCSVECCETVFGNLGIEIIGLFDLPLTEDWKGSQHGSKRVSVDLDQFWV